MEEGAISRMKADELDRLVVAGKIGAIDRERVRFIVRTIVHPPNGKEQSGPLFTYLGSAQSDNAFPWHFVPAATKISIDKNRHSQLQLAGSGGQSDGRPSRWGIRAPRIN